MGPYRKIADDFHTAELQEEEREIAVLARDSTIRRWRAGVVVGLLVTGILAAQCFVWRSRADVAALRCHKVKVMWENAEAIPPNTWDVCR
jgi:hypothetical protein